MKEIVTLSSRYGIVTPYTSFLVQEPSLALSQEGRDQLGRALQGQPPTGGRGGGSAGAPTPRRLPWNPCSAVTAADRRPSRRPSPRTR